MLKKFREFRVRVPMNEKGEITGFLRLEGWHFISQRMRNGEVQELKTPHLVARQDTEDATYCGHSLFEWTPTKPEEIKHPALVFPGEYLAEHPMKALIEGDMIALVWPDFVDLQASPVIAWIPIHKSCLKDETGDEIGGTTD